MILFLAWACSPQVKRSLKCEWMKKPQVLLGEDFPGTGRLAALSLLRKEFPPQPPGRGRWRVGGGAGSPASPQQAEAGQPCVGSWVLGAGEVSSPTQSARLLVPFVATLMLC